MPNALIQGLATTISGSKPQFENAVASLAEAMEISGWVKIQVPFVGQWTQTKYYFEGFQNQIFRLISVDGGESGKIISDSEEEIYLPNPENYELVSWPFEPADISNPGYYEDVRIFLKNEINDLGGVDGRWLLRDEQVLYEDDYQVQSIWEYFDESSEGLELPDASQFVMGSALRSNFGGPQRGGFVMTSQWLDNSSNKIVIWLQYPDAPIVFNSYPAWYATDQALARIPHPGFFKPERSTAKLRMPGMEDTKFYGNPYTVFADAQAQGQDGTTNHLSAGILRLFGSGSRAGYASAVSNFRASKHADLHALIRNNEFYDQNHAMTFDMLYARMFRLNTEVDTKKWPDNSIQFNEVPIVHRLTEFPDYYLAGFLPHVLIAHSNYTEGDVVTFDGRRYVAFGNGPNTLMCELPPTG